MTQIKELNLYELIADLLLLLLSINHGLYSLTIL